MPIAVLLFALATVVGLDQWSKHVASIHLSDASFELIPGVFSLSLAHNTGIAFSFPLEGSLLSGVTIALILLIIGYYWRHARRHPSLWIHAGYGLLLGGALANAYDRIFLGAVIDFLSLRHFAVFNVADMAISLGVLILLIFAYHERNTQSC
jgi:signal peptidase II